ncbi:hypothetical protein CPB86DRAFT_463756 [Serendipita vermifera]|nr:hypothetical protein CPB86DRAFT_463756 [Serendipita vermifera]
MTWNLLRLLDLIWLLLLFWANSVGAVPASTLTSTSTSTAETGSEGEGGGQKCYEDGYQVQCTKLKVVPTVIIFTLLGLIIIASCTCRFVMDRRGITIQELVGRAIQQGYANAEAHANRNRNRNAMMFLRLPIPTTILTRTEMTISTFLYILLLVLLPPAAHMLRS